MVETVKDFVVPVIMCSHSACVLLAMHPVLLPSQTTGEVEDYIFIFTPAVLTTLGISNSLVFSDLDVNRRDFGIGPHVLKLCHVTIY